MKYLLIVLAVMTSFTIGCTSQHPVSSPTVSSEQARAGAQVDVDRARAQGQAEAQAGVDKFYQQRAKVQARAGFAPWGNATVTHGGADGYAWLNHSCAYDVDGARPVCRVPIAKLRVGDRLNSSSIQRARNGQDLYEVQTAQGWDGYMDVSDVVLDSDNPAENTRNATVIIKDAGLDNLCAFDEAEYTINGKLSTHCANYGKIANLEEGDRLEVLGPVRLYNKARIYQARTAQGKDGWVAANWIVFDDADGWHKPTPVEVQRGVVALTHLCADLRSVINQGPTATGYKHDVEEYRQRCIRESK
jgi:hypothetical protein